MLPEIVTRKVLIGSTVIPSHHLLISAPTLVILAWLCVLYYNFHHSRKLGWGNVSIFFFSDCERKTKQKHNYKQTSRAQPLPNWLNWKAELEDDVNWSDQEKREAEWPKPGKLSVTKLACRRICWKLTWENRQVKIRKSCMHMEFDVPRSVNPSINTSFRVSFHNQLLTSRMRNCKQAIA